MLPAMLDTTTHVKYNEELIQDVIARPTARQQTSKVKVKKRYVHLI